MSHLNKGAPTAFSGYQDGVKRRFRSLQRIISISNKTVIDVGCGLGGNGEFASMNGAQLVIGVELVKKHLLSAPKSIQRVQCDVLHLPFKNKTFDIAICAEVLEHLSDDKKGLCEIKRVIEKNGFLLLTVPNKFYPIETHGLHGFNDGLIGIPRIGMPFFSWVPQFIRNNIETARIYTEKNLVKLLQSIGFEVTLIDYMMPPLEWTNRIKQSRFRPPLRKLNNEFERLPLVRYFGVSIIAVVVNTLQNPIVNE